MQNEAALIVTGCTKLVAIVDLYREAGWESLSQRRRNRKLIPFYEMIKGGYLDFSHLTELKNIYITEIYMKKKIQIVNN